MSMKTLSRQVKRLRQQIAPRPRIMDCTGVRNELLARLALTDDEEDTTTYEEYQRVADELTAFLGQNIQHIEQEYNVRFV